MKMDKPQLILMNNGDQWSLFVEEEGANGPLGLPKRLITPCFGEFNMLDLHELIVVQPDPKSWPILTVTRT